MEMTEEQAAYLLFEEDYDCAQAVLTHAAEDLELEEETAMKLASAFGGGMQKGDMCGCVTGALMALGLKYGFSDPVDKADKDRMTRKAEEFERRFAEACGALRCRELLGCDVSTSEGKIAAGEVIPARCPRFVTEACRILDEMLED